MLYSNQLTSQRRPPGADANVGRQQAPGSGETGAGAGTPEGGGVTPTFAELQRQQRARPAPPPAGGAPTEGQADRRMAGGGTSGPTPGVAAAPPPPGPANAAAGSVIFGGPMAGGGGPATLGSPDSRGGGNQQQQQGGGGNSMEDQLRQQWQNFAPLGPFAGPSMQNFQQQGFGFQPFQSQQGGAQGPQAFGYQQFQGGPQSNFQPQQYQAVGAPQATQIGQFNPQGGQFNQQLGQAIGANMQNPGRYDSALAQQVFGDMNSQLNTQFNMARQQIDEDAARRGLHFSSVPVGRYGDLAAQQAQAQRGFATDITREAAMANAADRSQALGMGLQYGGQQFNQDLSSFNANAGAQNQNFQNQLAQAAFQGDQQAQQVLSSLQNSQFGLGQNAQNFNQGLAGFNANLGAQQQNFGQQLQQGQFDLANQAQNFNQAQQSYNTNLGGQNQAFNQQLASNQFNFGQQQQGWNNAMQQYQMNMGAQDLALQNLLGYGQQGFQNQLAQAQFNQSQDALNQQLLMQLLGGGY